MNHFISLQQAKDMTALYRNNKDAILQAGLQKDILPLNETFDRSAFDTVLQQPGCIKLRIYYGMNSNLKIHAIIVGVNANNEDMLPATISGSGANAELSSVAGTNDGDDDNNIIELGVRCPPECPPPSDLNQ